MDTLRTKQSLKIFPMRASNTKSAFIENTTTDSCLPMDCFFCQKQKLRNNLECTFHWQQSKSRLIYLLNSHQIHFGQMHPQKCYFCLKQCHQILYHQSNSRQDHLLNWFSLSYTKQSLPEKSCIHLYCTRN